MLYKETFSTLIVKLWNRLFLEPFLSDARYLQGDMDVEDRVTWCMLW